MQFVIQRKEKVMPNETDRCLCGGYVNGTITQFMTPHKGQCVKCDNAYYIEDAPIDWEKVARG